jgi:hypothetical protein
MPAPTIRPAADPFDDIDRASSGVDSSMGRQDRADIPGERSDHPDAGSSGDKYIDATRAVSEGAAETDPSVLEDHEGSRVILGEEGLGGDDDDPIDETERAGDDTLR